MDHFLSDEWVDPSDDVGVTERNFAELLASVETPEELHAMVAGFNWDAGSRELSRILDHPRCDVATVLLAYWRSGPRYFCRYRSEADIPQTEIEGWMFVKRTHDRLLARRAECSHVGFDPHHDTTNDGYDWTSDYVSEALGNSFYVIPRDFMSPIARTVEP